MAQAQLGRLLVELEDIGDAWGVATTLHSMTRLRTIFEDYDGADDLFARSVEAAEALGEEFTLALTLCNVLYFRIATGALDDARVVAVRLLDLLRATGIRHPLPDTLEACALLEAAMDAPERAAELAATAASAREASALPMWGPASSRYERLLERLRSILGEAAFDDAWQRGLRLRVEDIHLEPTEPVTKRTSRST